VESQARRIYQKENYMKKLILLSLITCFLVGCATLNNANVYKPTDIKYVSMDSKDSIPEWVRNLYETDKIGGYNPRQFTEDEKYNLAYKVTFENGKGVIVEKFWHKTHLFAFTTKERGKDTYTTIADKKMGEFSLVVRGEFKYNTYDTRHWKTRHPEPDDFNPYEHDPKYRQVTRWRKACEWWPM
jgi:hypothetical protein